jgi:hypothetical protein
MINFSRIYPARFELGSSRRGAPRLVGQYKHETHLVGCAGVHPRAMRRSDCMGGLSLAVVNVTARVAGSAHYRLSIGVGHGQGDFGRPHT